MKKAIVLALSVVGFFLIAAPTAVEYHPAVFVNGKPFGNGIIIEGGIIAISVEDLAKSVGGTLTLPPTLKLDRSRLFTIIGPEVAQKKAVTPPSGGLVPAVQVKDTAGLKQMPGQFLKVQRAGEISSKVTMHNGKAYFPLADLARALGMSGNTISGNITGNTINGNGNEPIRLNSTPNGILIGL